MENNANVSWKTKVADKARETKNKVENGLYGIAKFCMENPITATLMLGVTSSAIKHGAKAYRDHNEMIRRRRDFFDPRTGRHCFSKRDLDANEQNYVDARYENGDTYVKILSDMGLLK